MKKYIFLFIIILLTSCFNDINKEKKDIINTIALVNAYNQLHFKVTANGYEIGINSTYEYYPCVVDEIISESFLIVNNWHTDLVINEITISNNDYFELIIDGEDVLPITLEAGESTSFNVEFKPTETGYKNCTVIISSDDDFLSIYEFYLLGLGI